MALDPQVEQYVARAGIETGDYAVRWQIGQVGDAADIDDDAMRGVGAEHGGVKGRDQRRALAASGDVAAAEIRDHADAGELGKQRRVADLQGVAGVGAVTNGLAVTAAGAYRRRRRARLLEPVSYTHLRAH